MFKIIKIFFNLLLLSIILTGIAIGYARYIAPYHLKTIDLSLDAPNLTAESDIKIAVFSDTHFSDWYTVKDFQKVINTIKDQSPDMIVFAGDLIDYYDQYDGNVDDIINSLSELSAPLGKFAVYGNHDYGGGAEWKYEGIMVKAGFKVLKDEYYPFDKLHLSLIGIDDIVIGSGNPEMASWGRDDYYNIVLCHEPDVVDQMLDYHVNLMISGHTHGGQINLPGYTDKFLPPYGEHYLKGLFNFDNQAATQLYVTSGVGMTKLPFRFMAPPDVTFITLKKAR